MSDTDSPEPEPTPAVTPAPPVPEVPVNPFVPRYREPWVNPAKKGAALAVAAAAAVVLLALGFLLGLGLGGLGGHRHEFGPWHELRVEMRHPGMYGPQHGWAGYHPRGFYRPGPPVPSTSHS
ncbi:MAG TPA: hypothetical protein VIG48_07810 [Jatrophihabitans sp.]